MAEGKGVALAILGIVAVIAVVGLIMLFKGGTGEVVVGGIYGPDKTYGGWERAQEGAPRGNVGQPNQGTWVKGVPTTWEGQKVAVVGGSQATYRVPTPLTTCPSGQIRVGSRNIRALSDNEFNSCVLSKIGDGSFCCEFEGLDTY